MADEDRHAFHEYIFARDGYLVPERWPTRDIPIAVADADATEIGQCRILKIYKEDLFPRKTLLDRDWITWHQPTQRFFVHGPGIEYLVSFQDQKGIHRGRLYMGLVTPSSFIKPHESTAGARALHGDKYKAVENFYKSCARYLRANYRKDDVGFYHGEYSDVIVSKTGVPKLQI